MFTYSLDLDGLLKVHAVERHGPGDPWRGGERHGTFQRGGSTGRAEPRRSVVGWGRGLAGKRGVGRTPRPADAAVDAGGDAAGRARRLRETLERAEGLLEAAPPEDQEEMIDLMEDLRGTLAEGRLDDAEVAHAALDELLYYLD